MGGEQGREENGRKEGKYFENAGRKGKVNRLPEIERGVAGGVTRRKENCIRAAARALRADNFRSLERSVATEGIRILGSLHVLLKGNHMDMC
jgi:hypothetical protein